MRDNVVERHPRSRKQVPGFSQAHWKHRLKIPVVVPVAVVQLEVVKLIRDGPDVAHRVGKLPVQLARRFFSTRGFGDRTEAKILTALQRNAKRNMRVRGKRFCDWVTA